MLTFAVDLGSTTAGYAILQDQTLIDAGIIKITGSPPHDQRLYEIYNIWELFINTFQPDLIVVETALVSKNVKSAFSVAQSQASLVLLSQKYNIELIKLSPGQIKKHITGKGNATKQEVAEIVLLQFSLYGWEKYTDLTDAIAIGITGIKYYA